MADVGSISSKAATVAAPASAHSEGARTVFNAISLDAKTPIPLEYNGTWYTTRKGARYIPFLNPDDDFPQKLLEARVISPTANACINTKTKYTLGKGWYLTDESLMDVRLKDWVKSVNRTGQTLNDLLLSVFDSYYTFGNAYIKLARVRIGSSKYLKVSILNTQDVRLITNEDDGIPTSVAVSRDFRKQGFTTLRKNAYDEFPLWTPDKVYRKWAKDSNGDECCIIHLKNEVSGYDYYGMPSNVSGLIHQVLEYKAARYNLDEFDNNMVVGGILILDTGLTQEEADTLGRKIVKQHTGDGKRGRVMILAGETAGENSKYLPFEKHQEGDYIRFDEHTEDKIISANEWDPLLAGIRRESGLGNGGTAYIRSIFDIKNETVIKPVQDKVIEKVIQPIMQMCDEWMGTRWADLPFAIRTSAPVSFAGDIDVNSIVKKNEGRNILGLPTLEEGQGGEEFIKQPSSISINAQQEGAGDVQTK